MYITRPCLLAYKEAEKYTLRPVTWKHLEMCVWKST